MRRLLSKLMDQFGARCDAVANNGAGRLVAMDDTKWNVYIVRCRDASLYTGIAKVLATRIEQHNAGKGAKYTRSRRPVELIYSETAADKGAALRRESEIKRLSAAAKRRLANV